MTVGESLRVDRGREQSETCSEQRTDAVFDVLVDSDCRAILETIADEPQTAAEIEGDLGISTSTLYRKLNRLSEADLIRESVRLDTGGAHPSEYSPAFSEVSLALDDGSVTVTVTPDGSGDDRAPRLQSARGQNTPRGEAD